MAYPESEDPQNLDADFAEVDAALTTAFAGLTLPPHFQARVHARLRPPPVMPALFDLAGAIGILMILAVLAFAFAPDIPVDVRTVLAIGSLLALVSVLLAYRTVAKA